jgi:hypothetical protein
MDCVCVEKSNEPPAEDGLAERGVVAFDEPTEVVMSDVAGECTL